MQFKLILILLYLEFILANCSLWTQPPSETMGMTTTERPIKSFTPSSETEMKKLSPSKFGNKNKTTSSSMCEGFCTLKICTESNITIVQQNTEFNWKIQRLRQYILYLKSVNSSKIFLSKKIPFTSLPTYDADWLFELEAGERDVELRVSSEFQVTVDHHIHHVNYSDLTFEIKLQVMDGNFIISSTFLQKAIPILIDPVFGIYAVEFTWSEFQNALGLNLEENDSLMMMLKTNPVQLRFFINSKHVNEIISTDVECNDKHDDDFDENGSKRFVDSPRPPFLESIGNMMKDDKYTDLIVKSGDEEFKVHRAILAHSSPVLARMIFNNTLDRNESLLDLGAEIGSDVVEEIIRYIYTGKIDDIEEIADRIIIAANSYGFPELKRICEIALIEQLRIENAFSMYLLANEVNAERLRRIASNLMKENKSKIVNQTEDFRKLSVHHPDIMYELFLS